MRRLLASLAALLVFVGVLAAPGSAITGGRPDGEGHPYVGLLLVPGQGFCSGTLISSQTILTAGHCTAFFDEFAKEDSSFESVMVSFDPVASVDADWMPAGGTWYTASSWLTHPDYVDADWPATFDYGLLYLDAPVGIEPADLPTANILDPIVDAHGQTSQRFDDVGYGVQGTVVGGGPPRSAVTWTRKVAEQRYAPGNGAVSGTTYPLWFFLGNVPSPQHGGSCGGDSGSPILWGGTDTIVAVHTGGYRLGFEGVICGRITALNHRIDVPEVLAWITANTK